MAIKDLEPRQGNVDIVIEIVEKGEVRQFQKFGRSGKVCSAKAKDETGEINLSLWNEQIDQVDVGDKIHIINGYVNEFQGEMQLTTGKFGKLEVVEKSKKEEENKAGKPFKKPEEQTPEESKAKEEEFIE